MYYFNTGLGLASELLTRFAVKTRSYYVQLFPAVQRPPDTADSRKAQDEVCGTGNLSTKGDWTR